MSEQPTYVGAAAFRKNKGRRTFADVPTDMGTVRIRSITESERSAIARVCAADESYDLYSARMACASLCDETGTLYLNWESADDVETMAGQPLPDSQPITKAIERLNKLGESIEDTAGN